MKSALVRKFTIGILILCMLFSSLGFVFAASSTSDIKGHWAESQLNSWIEKGFIEGYADGSFKPNHSITRAEFVALVNHSFHFTEKTDVSFTDVNSSHWAIEEVARAVKAGYIQGYSDGSFGANKVVSRQEVAVMIGRLLKMESMADDQGLIGFKDKDTFAEWSKASIRAVTAKKIMQGYAADQTFRPQAPITRAEAVVTLDHALQSQNVAYNSPGVYGAETGMQIVNHDVVINTSGVTLKNMIINGNLLLAEGIGSGDAFLKNVTVKGITTVQGGGEHSIHFENSILITIIVDKHAGTVRIVAEGSTKVDHVIVQSAVTIEETNMTGDGFTDVKLTDIIPADSKVELKGAFETLVIIGKKIIVNIPEGSVKQVNVDDQAIDGSLDLGKDAKIIKLVLEAVMKMIGQGTIDNAIIGDKGKDTTFEKQPVKIEGSGTTPTPTVAPTPSVAPIATSTPAPSSNNDGNNGNNGGNISTTLTSEAYIADIHVANGTLLSSAGLPATVKVTLSDTSTPNVNVQWDGGTPAYDGSTAGTYAFTGTLALPNGVTNPTNVKAAVDIVVAPAAQAITVTSAAYIADIHVANGTLWTATGLPTTVNVTLSDTSTSNVNVQWDGGTPAYDGSTAGTYAFTGTLALPNGVTNPNNVKAAVNVVVAPAAQANIVTNASVIADIPVANGTLLAAAGLPATFKVTLSDTSTPNVNVQWDGGTPAYDGSTAGTYAFTGTLALPNGVTNPTNVKAALNVVVAPAAQAITVTNASAIADIHAAIGTSLSSVTAGLPQTLQISLSDGSSPTVGVASWSSGSYASTGNVGGVHTFKGALILPNGVGNPNAIQASVKVIVELNTTQETALNYINAHQSTFTAQNLTDAGVTNINPAYLTSYQWQVDASKLTKNAFSYIDLSLNEVQSAIDKVNSDALILPTASAMTPVKLFGNQSPGDGFLQSGDHILLAFNVKLSSGAVAAIQTAVDTALGNGNITVTTGNNVTFNLIVTGSSGVSIPSGKFVTLIPNAVQNYVDGSIANTATIDFFIEDDQNTTPQLTNGYNTSGGSNIILTFSHSLSGSTADPAAFTISGVASAPTVTSAGISNDTVTLGLSAPMKWDDQVKLSYSPQNNANDLQSTANVKVQGFVNAAIINFVNAPQAIIQNVTATNGEIAIVLGQIPAIDPIATDFMATSGIAANGTLTQTQLLDLNNFNYNKANGTVTYSFTPFGRDIVWKSVIVAVNYQGTHTEASKYYLRPVSFLGSLITAATNIKNAASSNVGANEGQYNQMDINLFNSEIDAAILSAIDPGATQLMKDEAADLLEEQVYRFQTKVHTLLNKMQLLNTIDSAQSMVDIAASKGQFSLAALNTFNDAITVAQYQAVATTASTGQGMIDSKRTLLSYAMDLFCKQVINLNNTDALELDTNALDIYYGQGDTDSGVTQNVTLMSGTIHGFLITWASSDSSTISSSGVVTRPAQGSQDATVTLTATISKNNITDTKIFTLNVKAMP
jgi:hypothetical protein